MKLFYNIIIFIFFSLIITYLSNRVTKSIYYYKAWLYKERAWERHGKFYDEKFRVKKWKKKVPELGDFVKSVFPKKYIKEYSEEYISMYLLESCKAELTHWVIILSTIFFMLWNELLVSVGVFLIAFILNIPFIIIQRYNRPRIIQIMERKGIEY
jgi:glycosyl-4,4'-diaponeurosporenoate acyltransferase